MGFYYAWQVAKMTKLKPLKKYEKIRTKYVRNKLKQAGLKDKDYIDALIRIEQFAITGWKMGLHSGYERVYLQDHFPKEWKAIDKEICPEDYSKKNLEAERKERAKEKKETAQIDREERLEAQRELAAWKKAIKKKADSRRRK